MIVEVESVYPPGNEGLNKTYRFKVDRDTTYKDLLSWIIEEKRNFKLKILAVKSKRCINFNGNQLNCHFVFHNTFWCNPSNDDKLIFRIVDIND